MEAGRDDMGGAGGAGSLGLKEAPSGPAGDGDADEQLIGLVADGDAVAFEELFARHRGAVLSVCRRLLGPAEAEDALQQTFLAAYLAIARRGERPRHLRGWLRSIARNECISELRRRRASASMPHEVVDPASATDDVAMQKADVRGIVDDVRRLPSDQRAALLLSGIDERPHDEIAEHLDCRTGKVKALVFQARATLTGLRAAREVPCHRVREQVSRARVGRPPAGITRHLQTCPACAEFASEFREERRGAVLLIPFGAALAWVRSLFGAGGASAHSTVAAAAGGAAAGPAAGAGLAKLAIVVVVGGAAAGAGAGGLGDGGQQESTPERAASTPWGSGPAGATASGTTAIRRGDGTPRRAGPAQGGERSPASDPFPHAGDDPASPGQDAAGDSPAASPAPGTGEGPTVSAPGAPQESGSATSAPAGGPSHAGRPVAPPSDTGPDGTGPPADTPGNPPPAGPEPAGSDGQAIVGRPPLRPGECPVPALAHSPVC